MYAGHPQKGREAALRGSMRAQRMSCDGDVFTIRRDDGYPAAMLHRVHLFLAGLALSALTVSLAPLPVLAVEKGKAVQAPAARPLRATARAGRPGVSAPPTTGTMPCGMTAWRRTPWRKRALGRDRGNSSSIEHALREADRQAKAESRKAKEAEREAEEKSRLGMNIRRDDSVWRAELPSSEARPDELRPLERRHVVRAYADFMDSDDASLTIGRS